MTAEVSPSATGAAALPKAVVVTLSLALFAMAVSLSFVFAVLPPIGRDLGLSELQVGLIVAPAALVFVIANGVWGLLIDRIGRKPVVVTAIVAATLTTAAFGWIVQARLVGSVSVTAAFALLCTCRIGLGALAGGFLPAAQALIADTTPPEHRTRGLAIIGAGFALGTVVGPGIASAFSGYSPVAPFYVVAVLTGAAALIVAFVLPGQHSKTGPRPPVSGRTGVGQLWPLLAIVIFVYTAYGILLHVTGFRLQDQFALSGPQAAGRTGIALMMAAAGLVAAQVIIARSRMSTHQSVLALLAGSLAAFVAMALLWRGGGFPEQLFGLGLFGIGLGTVLPSSLGLLTVMAEPAGDQGRVGGFSGAAQGLGMFFGPLASAVSYRSNHAFPYLVGLALLALVIALAMFLRLRQRENSR